MKIISKFYDDAGNLHKEDGPAIEFEDGSFSWYYHGVIHNPNGIAVKNVNIVDSWFQNGKLHRLDGPAIIYYSVGVPNDHLMEPKIKLMYWHLNGKAINCSSQEEFERLIKLKSFL